VQQVSDAVDQIEFSWDEIGTKTITVTTANAGGTVTNTKIVEIKSLTPIVSLSGPAESSVGIENVFVATCIPSDVVQPITYTWQASGQLPITHSVGLSDTVRYGWDYPGTQVITVTATNVEGSTSDTFSLPVRMPPVSLEVTGPDVGVVMEIYRFTATVNPITTTVPITYVWSVGGQPTITDTAGIFDTVTLSWDQPGLRQLSISASNPAGSVVDTRSITIYVRVFLPISLRH
jgi:hypothetical protein